MRENRKNIPNFEVEVNGLLQYAFNAMNPIMRVIKLNIAIIVKNMFAIISHEQRVSFIHPSIA